MHFCVFKIRDIRSRFFSNTLSLRFFARPSVASDDERFFADCCRLVTASLTSVEILVPSPVG